MTTKTHATVEDLYHLSENGKAEVVGGELILMAPTGFWPSRAAGAIYRSLSNHEQKNECGLCRSRQRWFYGQPAQ